MYSFYIPHRIYEILLLLFRKWLWFTFQYRFHIERKRLTSEIQLSSYNPRHYCIVLVKVYEKTKVHDLKDEEIKNK